MPRLFLNNVIRDESGSVVSYFNPLVEQAYPEGPILVLFNDQKTALEAASFAGEFTDVACWPVAFEENDPDEVFDLIDDVAAVIVVDPADIPEKYREFFEWIVKTYS